MRRNESMYCGYCGAELPNKASFCPHCGKRLMMQDTHTDNLNELVEKARAGSKDAFSDLYEQTYSKVYYTVKSMVKDEDAVIDILQDSYIKAFTHLDNFEGNTRFLPWVRQIAANTARDWLKKQKPLLFSELNHNDESESPVEERFVDDREASIPEQVIDQAETKRLIQEIIDELPDDQRAAIGMYYYEEMSVREIAEAMGATENAVKSRLLYGRRKIEKKVRELEKRGTKLYGLAPIPFLLLLFRSQKAYASEIPDTALLDSVLNELPSSGYGTNASTFSNATKAGSRAAARASASTAASAGGLTAGKIALIAVASVSVITAGIFGIAKLSNHNEVTPSVVSEVVSEAETPVAVSEYIDDTESNLITPTDIPGWPSGSLIGQEEFDETIEFHADGSFDYYTNRTFFSGKESPDAPDNLLHGVWHIQIGHIIRADDHIYSLQIQNVSSQVLDEVTPIIENGREIPRGVGTSNAFKADDTVTLILPGASPQETDGQINGAYNDSFYYFNGIPFSAEPLQIEEPSEDETALNEAETQNEENLPDEASATDAYRVIIQQADTYDYQTYGAQPTGSYHYALVPMSSDQTIPALLLGQETDDYMDHIRIFQYDTATDMILMPDEVLVQGVAQTGGYRGTLQMAAGGYGVQETAASGGTGAVEIYRRTLDGSQLISSSVWSGQLGESPPAEFTGEGITWYDVSDLNGLNMHDIIIQGAQPEIAISDPASGFIAQEESAGRIVLTGTIGTYDYDTVVSLQGVPDYNGGAERGSMYRLIVLDEPQTLTLTGIDGPQSGEARLISIQEASIPDNFDGQTVVFSIDPSVTYWPSDTSLPVGQPRTGDVHILN